MARKSGNITILQFDEGMLGLLRIKAGAGVDVLAHEIERGKWAPDTLPDALKDFVSRHEVGADRIFTVLPRHEVTTRILEMPSQSPGEIDGMIQLSAEEFVPYPLNELVIAHAILERMDTGGSRVLVVLAHKDVIQRRLATLKHAGVDPEQIFLSTACLISACAARGPADSDCYGLANVASGGLEFLVMRGKTAEYGRGVASHQDWTDDAAHTAVVEELAGELRHSLSAHRRESPDGVGASEVFVSSDWADAQTLAGELAHELDVLCAPADFTLDLVKAGRDKLKGIPVAALGAALSAQGRGACTIQLLPRQEVERRALATLRTSAMQAAVASVVLLAGLAGLYFQAVGQREAYIARLENMAEDIRPDVREMVAKRRHLERLQRQVERKDTALELFAALTRMAPPEGVNLTRFNFRRGDGVQVFGRAVNRGQVLALAERLRELGQSSLPQFVTANVEYTNDGRERHADIINYGITIPFPAELRAEEEAE
ncbi:MAG: pilus assembly protein PilM [Candidatus Hydrogenedentales bacterium]